jgi:arylsulfatase A-like enzyme
MKKIACLLLWLTSVTVSAEQRPNILLIVVDDLGYGELGCYGGTQIPTPRIDELAEAGIRFTNGYVTAPFCAASRAALMTGRYQTRFGFEFNPIGAKNVEPGIGLPCEETTLADYLRDAGYATGLVGKWHLGGTAPFHPQRRGFDEFFGFLHEGHYYLPSPWAGSTTWLRRSALPDGNRGRWVSSDGQVIWSTHLGRNEPEYDADNPIFRNGQPENEQSNLTDAFTREACDFIQRHREQPFFLYLAYNAVHSPMQASDEYLRKFLGIEDIHRRIFAAMLSHLDDSIGRVIDSLRTAKLEERTLVFFISDNGGPTKELTSSNHPFRGGKGELWEGGIRVPFIAKWKGHLLPSTWDSPVTNMDLTVTAMEIASKQSSTGAKVKKTLDGRSLLKLMKQGEQLPGSDPIFWRVGKKNAIRQGDWKLIRDGGPWQLYNLKRDPSETKDLAASSPERVEELSRGWDAWNAEQLAPLW